MALQVTVLAAKPDYLSLIPGTQIMEGDDYHKLSSDLHLYIQVCTLLLLYPLYTHKHNKQINTVIF